MLLGNKYQLMFVNTLLTGLPMSSLILLRVCDDALHSLAAESTDKGKTR